MKNPCQRDCPDRSPTCHQKCEAYLAFFEYRQRENEQRYKKNRMDYESRTSCGKRKRY